MLLVPQAHRHGLVSVLLQEEKLLAAQLPKTIDLLWVFFVSSHGEAQRCGKIVVADALVSCVGMMVRKQTEQIEEQRKSGDARERSSIPRFNPHPTEARTRSPESVTLCPRSVCLQGGKIEERKECLSLPTGEIIKAKENHHTWSLTAKSQMRQLLTTASRCDDL